MTPRFPGLLGLFLVLFLAGCDDRPAPATPVAPPDDPAILRYLAAMETQAAYLRDVHMTVEMTGRIPKLSKEGKMQARRKVSADGKVSYEAIQFTGDKTVKDNVIVNYMKAEANPPRYPMEITATNYKFRNRGVAPREGYGNVQIIELTPRRNAVGLFKGEIWTDPATGAPVRESGRFSKSPSVFLKSVDFVRTYHLQDGTSVPRTLSSFIDTRIAGRAELVIAYSEFAKGVPVNPAVTPSAVSNNSSNW